MNLLCLIENLFTAASPHLTIVELHSNLHVLEFFVDIIRWASHSEKLNEIVNECMKIKVPVFLCALPDKALPRLV